MWEIKDMFKTSVAYWSDMNAGRVILNKYITTDESGAPKYHIVKYVGDNDQVEFIDSIDIHSIDWDSTACYEPWIDNNYLWFDVITREENKNQRYRISIDLNEMLVNDLKFLLFNI